MFFSGVTFVVVFFFVSVVLISLKPRPFVQSIFDIHAPPAATGSSNLTTSFVCFYFFGFVFNGDVAFSQCFVPFIAVPSLYEKYVVRFFFPGGVFLRGFAKKGYTLLFLRQKGAHLEND